MGDFIDPLEADFAEESSGGDFVDPLDVPDMPVTEVGEYQNRAANMSQHELSIARSKNDRFGTWLRKQALQERPDETKEQRFKRLYGDLGYKKEEIGYPEGLIRGYAQGGYQGGGDEVVAGMAATVNANDIGGAWNDRYTAYLDRERSKIDQFRDESKIGAYGSEILGAAATAAIPVSKGIQGGSNLGTKMLRAGGIGGIEGGIYGFNQGEGGFQNRATEGAITGAISAPIAGAVPLVGAGARNLWNTAAIRRVKNRFGFDPTAYSIMTDPSTYDPGIVQRGQANIRKAGPNAMLAEADPAFTDMLDTAVQRSGAAGTKARNAVTERVNQATPRFRGAMDDVLGPEQGLNKTAREISEGTRDARSNAYKAAYDTPIDYDSAAGKAIDDVLLRIDDDTFNKAIKEANADMLEEFGWQNYRQISPKKLPNGKFEFDAPLNVQQLDALKRSLDRFGQQVDQFGRPTGESIRASNQARRLRKAIVDATKDPETGESTYEAALKVGKDKISEDQALDMGRQVFKPSLTREIVAEAAEGMSDAERARAGQGIRAAIEEKIANVKMAMTDTNMDPREAVKGLKEFSSRAVREKVSALIGEEQAARLFTEFDEVARAFSLQANVAANSRTFTRTAIDKTVKDRTEGGLLNAARQGKPLDAAGAAIQNFAGGTAEDFARRQDAVYGSLVDMLTGPRGQEAAGLLSELAMRRARGDAISPQVERAVNGLLAGSTPAGTAGILDTMAR